MRRPRGFPAGIIRRWCITACGLLWSLSCWGNDGGDPTPLRVAVASNFSRTLESIAQRFQQRSGYQVQLSAGASGRQYAQIRHGAPFAAFFSADRERAERLEDQGLAVAGSRFTYAQGRLALWSPRAGLVDAQGQVLHDAEFAHLAIANPRLAPYGKAAQQLLQAEGLWHRLQRRLVRGENVAQAYQFVRSGNAELGLVAYAQVQQAAGGSLWLPPARLYAPIEQQAVLLRRDAGAEALLQYVRSDEARAIIRAHGYITP